ncbi:MAG: cytochrome c oxidase subunit II [Thaumarchaeota archaeon]|nr:cytochrome c oxidase subunit II [Nitrososphaerota archaeon]
MYSGILSSLPSTVATYDFLFNWYLFFGVGAAVVVISLLVFFMYRYRYRGESGPPPVHKTEGWKIVLVTVLISISVLTAAEYQTFASFGNIEMPSQCSAIPDPCVTIRLSAFQWGWNFTYPDGKFAVSTQNQPLTVPAGTIVIMNITSKDVFHSFGIPMLDVKEDAVPGKVNQLWFMASNTGFYTDAIRCFELCGVGHAFMLGNVSVIDAATWQTQFGGVKP